MKKRIKENTKSPKKGRIYLDNAALTPVREEVLKEMNTFSAAAYGNPSSLSQEGVAAAKAVFEARKKCAVFFGGHSDEIVFTGSGTEANNLAIFGMTDTFTISKVHLITSVIEHPSVLECFRAFEARGAKVDYVGVDEEGIIDPEAVRKLLRPETLLVSIMYANNEIGTIQPIAEIAKVIRSERKRRKNNMETMPLYFHTDASQAAQYLEMNVEKLGVDLATIDGHKVYGPRGIGALFARRGIALTSFIKGGGQESGRRSGTENLPAIAGLASALTLAAQEKQKETARLQKLRDYCIQQLLQKIPSAKLNGSAQKRLPNNINISIPDIDAEFTLLKLDAAGIACSTKSSCLKDEEASYVILKMTADKARAKTSLRFSLGRDTTKADIDFLVSELACMMPSHSL